MIEQIGNTIRFYGFFTASGAAKTGLADVTFTIYKNGSPDFTGSAGEIGSGLYFTALVSSNVDAEGEYICVFHTDDVTVDQKDVIDRWWIGHAGLENLDALISSRMAATTPVLAGSTPVPGAFAQGTAGWALGRIGRAGLTIVAPVAVDGTLTLVRNDDYLADDGRGITFTSDAWPDLTLIEEVRLTLRSRSSKGITGSTIFTVAHRDDLIVAAPSGTQSVTFDLSGDDTLLLTPGVGTAIYDVQARYGANPEYTRATLAIGTVTVLEDQTRIADEPA